MKTHLIVILILVIAASPSDSMAQDNEKIFKYLEKAKIYGDGTHTYKELIKSMGKPNNIISKKRCKTESDSILLYEIESIERREMAKKSNAEFVRDFETFVNSMVLNKNVQYLVYILRGYHDYLYFVLDNKKITHYNFYSAGE